jgi:hypothetical protein
MKYFLIILFAFFAFNINVWAQASPPEQAAKNFYKWYLTELNADRYPITRNKRLMLQKVSTRLGKWLYSKAYEEYGADYFIDAQDWERTWVSGITASDTRVSGNSANLKITLRPRKSSRSPFGMRVLHIKMVKENAVWKIDTVENRKLI